MRAVDTHCHLQMAHFESDREEVFSRTLTLLEWVIVVGDDIAASEAACGLVRDGVFAAVGVHPYHATHWTPDTEVSLRRLAMRPGVVALGETGLDYFNEFSPRGAQRACFERQLEMAAALDLPVIIHSRAADEDTLAILDNAGHRCRSVIMHCFGGGLSLAGACGERGWFVSFAGNVTFPKAESLRRCAEMIPLELLLAETDAPYLAPQPVRGKRCEPIHVLQTIDFLADLKKMDPELFGNHLVNNASRAFFK